jgi:leader peptidase (prepilin peptidase)/N-methyltransferase
MRGKPVEEDALGYGDVNLSGVLGLMLGWPGILAGLTIAILLGGAVSLIYLLVTVATRRYQAFTAIPYGPFLIAAAIVLLFFRSYMLSNL